MKIRIKTDQIEWECEGEPVAYEVRDPRHYNMSERPMVVDGDQQTPKEDFHHQKGVVECHRLFLEFLGTTRPIVIPDIPDAAIPDMEPSSGSGTSPQKTTSRKRRCRT